MKALLAALLFAAATATTASAAEVYRCGHEGRAYSDQPCAGGRAVDVADPRSVEQVQAARRVAALDRRLAEQAIAERRASERAQAAQNALPAGFRVSARPAPGPKDQARPGPGHKRHAHRLQHRPADADDGIFRATAPSTRRAKG